MMNIRNADDRAELSGSGEIAGARQACEALCRVLRDGIDIHRCFAAQALGRIGHPAAIESLVEALLDEDEDVRIDAAKALRRFPDPRAAKQLFENLQGDPCTDVKLGAIEVLARVRHPKLTPWLRRLLKGRDADIVWDEDEIYADGWDGWVDIQTRAIEALGELGADDAVVDIVEALDDEFGQDLTEVGFKALARLGDRGIAALARYLDDPSERRRRRAAAALAGTDAEAARDAVARALRDPSMNVRFAAARTLAARDPKDRRLAALFGDVSPEVRAEIVRVCGRSHPSRLETLLTDEVAAVRCAVLEVVADAPSLLPAEAIVDRTRAWLRGANAELAAAAAAALAVVDPAGAVDELCEQVADAARPLEVRLGAIKGLAATGDASVSPTLAHAVGDDQRQVRLAAMSALATLATSDRGWPNAASETLLAALRGELVVKPDDETAPATGDVAHTDDGEGPVSETPETAPDAAVAISTLESILDHGSRNSPPPVNDGESPDLSPEDMEYLAMSKNTLRAKRLPVAPQIAPYQDVRQLAGRVLGGLARDDVAQALAASLGDRDGDVRQVVADSLAHIAESRRALPTEVIDTLLATPADGDRETRLSIIRALGAAGGRATTMTLIGCLRDEDSFIRTEAVRALSRIDPGRAEIEALLMDADPTVRAAAARAVSDAGGLRAVDLLIDLAFAFGGYHRREVGRLLRRLDKAVATTRMLDVLDDRRRQESWQIAIEALDEMHRSDIASADEAQT